MEAGAYWLWTARFSSGKCGSWTRRSHALRSIVPVKRSISKAGVETIARRSPLRGSMTTTAPACPAMARSAASWIRPSTVVTTCAPECGSLC